MYGRGIVAWAEAVPHCGVEGTAMNGRANGQIFLPGEVGVQQVQIGRLSPAWEMEVVGGQSRQEQRRCFHPPRQCLRSAIRRTAQERRRIGNRYDTKDVREEGRGKLGSARLSQASKQRHEGNGLKRCVGGSGGVFQGAGCARSRCER